MIEEQFQNRECDVKVDNFEVIARLKRYIGEDAPENFMPLENLNHIWIILKKMDKDFDILSLMVFVRIVSRRLRNKINAQYQTPYSFLFKTDPALMAFAIYEFLIAEDLQEDLENIV